MRVHCYVFLSFSHDYIKKEIDYIKYQQCFNLLARVQYLHRAWFLDGGTSILVITLSLRNNLVVCGSPNLIELCYFLVYSKQFNV